jgi:hypothetical protein
VYNQNYLFCLKHFIIIALFLCFYGKTYRIAAQNLSNLRCKTFVFNNLPIQLDSLSIIPESIVSKSSQLFTIHYNLNTNQVTLKPLQNSPSFLGQEITLCYRVFPFLFTQKHFNRSQIKYDSGQYSQAIALKYPNQKPDERAELFKADKLTKNGSITRGISLGNRQDVFVNSALNLQLEGQLSDDIQVTAVLSDQNVPFQPEGNTQRLQEFDRIFIKLSHKYGALSAGDIIFQNRDSHFLKFYKNVLGGMIEIKKPLIAPQAPKEKAPQPPKGELKQMPQTPPLGAGGLSGLSGLVGFSIAKGRFHSQIVEVQEGVQGAYRLRGANNERFIVVIANAEKVFLDGKLLTRGFNYDYVIDYNTAEITFTNQVVITRYTRVRVDFEYSVQNYSRSIITANLEQQVKKWTFAGNFYREKDDESNPLLQTLTANDLQLLRNASDTATTVFAKGEVYVRDFQQDRVLYYKADTIINNQTYQFFRRADRQYDSLFSVVFSEVGFGRGDYVIGNPTANGRTYQWISPTNGISQGNYAPIRLLITPNQKQMITLASTYKILPTTKFFVEGALSNNNRNLFAENRSQNIDGNAIKIGLLKTQTPKTKADSIQKWLLTWGVDYEYNSNFFSPIDRFRYIEFDRDWGAINATQTLAADHILNTQAKIQKNMYNYVALQHTRRQRGEVINGFQQTAIVAKSFKNLYTQFNLFWLQNTQNIQNNPQNISWWRINSDIFYKFPKIITGYQYNLDKNEIKKANTDSVLSTAMNFIEHKIYVRQGDSAKWTYQTDFALRTDKLPFNGNLLDNTNAQTLNIAIKKQQNAKLFNFVFTYRNLENLQFDSLKNLPKVEETVMGRIDWNTSFWKENIKSELTLASATARELKREFRFILVNTGTGTHTWRDDNQNGQQELNEFYLAVNPDEKNYIKLFTPTDEYIPAFSNNFTYRLNITLPKTWQQKKGFLKTVSKLSAVASWAANKKITDNNFLSRFLPFSNLVDDKFLQSKQDVIRATIFYNRTSPAFGLEFGYFNSGQKQLLTNGFESRATQEWQALMRRNFGTKLNAKIALITDQKQNLSDFLENRNYLISGWQLKPEIAYQPSQAFRLTTTYIHHQKSNIFAENSTEKAQVNEFSTEIRWAEAVKRTLTSRFRLIHIDFVGEANSPVGYEMLEALQRGVNLTWSINWQQRLSNGLQLTVIYDGRKSENQAVAHVGRVQMTALF